MTSTATIAGSSARSGLATLSVLRPRTGAGDDAPMSALPAEWSARDDRLRRREVLLHHLELQRRRRARRSA